jgi:hypothetical protein
MAGAPLLCEYCDSHGLKASSLFAELGQRQCHSCGNRTAELRKPRVRERQASKGAASLPITHHPNLAPGDFPAYITHGFLAHGFVLEDPSPALRTTRELSAHVADLWRSCMNQSTCWMIHSQKRLAVFDIATGAVAGSIYFDTHNKYIPCLAVRSEYRRRSLGVARAHSASPAS